MKLPAKASAPEPTRRRVEEEAARLRSKGLSDLGYKDAELERLGRLAAMIKSLKDERGAVIPVHVYQRPEIIHGIADFVGDSYKLSKLCGQAKAPFIVFCGVSFMAETAKILNPAKTVLLPSPEAGCSLSESITGAEIRLLKSQHPGAPVATYINTSAEAKAESDVIVTSANARRILERLYGEHEKVVFLPDMLMGQNLARQLGKKPGRDIILWKGTCIVHDSFDAASVSLCRGMYPGVKILAHAECSPGLVSTVDFVGGTGDMLRYIESTPAPFYMLVTECGLGELARSRFPEKRFVPMCRLCPYMKSVTLERVLKALESPARANVVEVDPRVQDRARKALERMFELAEG
ncbi:MAG: quinolinate synthase NadA [Elusimicrobia bacterium]|nr:quinolinate synthase NadA [Elusimicrobiota bacterium]